MITLRSFCFRSIAGLAVLTFSPLAFARATVGRRRNSAGAPGFESFAAELGSVFKVDGGEHGTRAVQLVAAERKKPSPRANRRAPDADYEKFSLVFADGAHQRLAQRSYPFAHPRLGRFEMFIVPVGSLDPAVHKYEAIFNRPASV